MAYSDAWFDSHLGQDWISSNVINIADGGRSPVNQNRVDNISYGYWSRALLQRLRSQVVIEDCIWKDADVQDFLYFCLIYYGHVAVFKTPEFGLAFQPATLSGYNFYYMPTDAIVTNPLLQRTFKIHKDCEILRLTPDFRGVYDIIDYYAKRLSVATASLDVSLFNSRIPFLMYGGNKAAVKMLEMIYDRVAEGNPAIFVESKKGNDKVKDIEGAADNLHIETLPQANNFISGELIAVIKELLAMFDREIGITDLSEKKERKISMEVETEKEQSTARAETWVNVFNVTAKNVNDMFGTNMHMTLGGVDNGT